MKITVGGVAVGQSFSLADKFDEVVKETNKMIDSKNRDIRRSKPIKSILAVLGVITTLGYSSVARAEGINPMEDKGFFLQLADKLVLKDTDAGTFIKEKVKGSIMREDSVIWKMNDWFQHTLLHTQDFFDNPQILGFFNIIWYICMSCVTLIVGKKGFDMVKSKVLGGNSIGASELIIRLLACVVMTFLSLDIMQLGIHASNLAITTLFSAVKSALVPYEILEKTGGINVAFWFIGFMFMTIIISVQYWVRQITVTILGVLSPIATLSWVVDGGAMLGTLIREFITLLTTPIVHGVILTIGTIIIRELAPASGNLFMDGFNITMIGFSTMFLMIFTPTFLRKFITGTHNPAKWAVAFGRGVVGNTVKAVSFIKK
jgi:hypothetical protein